MGRHNEGKTETCLKRGVTVYTRSFEQKERWKREAKERDKPLSTFIIEAVENAIAPVTQNTENIKEIKEENVRLQEENSELRREKEVYKKLYETQEKELRKYRAQPFINEEFEGVRKYDKELVDTLRETKRSDGEQRVLSNDELLSRLSIEVTETEAVKAIYTQLENLEGYGLVKLTAKGWRWIA